MGAESGPAPEPTPGGDADPASTTTESAADTARLDAFYGRPPPAAGPVRRTIAGLAAGLAATLATTRILQGELFNVEARDPLLLGATALVLLLVAGVAAFLPARRAARIDPARALNE